MIYELSQQLFIKAIDFHIRLLKLDYTKHQWTQEVYEFAFELMHDLGEQYESLWLPVIEDASTMAMINELYQEFEDMKQTLADSIAEETDEWLKALYQEKLIKAQKVCAKLESLTKC